VVEGERIQAVGSADQVSTPRDTVSVDLGGMTLMPGLIDAHAYVVMVMANETEKVEDHHSGATYPDLVAPQVEDRLWEFAGE